MILTIVEPLRHLRHRLTGELLAVKVADKILSSTAAERSAGVDVADQHPLVFNLQHVGTLPDTTVIAVFTAETAFFLPVLQIGRRPDLHLLAHCQHHNPALGALVPEHLRVAEVGSVEGNHGVLLIFIKGASAVCRIGHRLGLSLSGRRVEGDDGIPAEACRVVLVNHARAAEDGADGICLNGQGQSFPVDKILRYAVAPCHVLPQRAVGVVLIVQMPLAILIEHTVGIVHPAVQRCMVIGRAELLAVGRIKGVREFDLLPAGELLDGALGTAVAVEDDVEHLAILYFKRYVIVGMIYGQTHVRTTHTLVILADHSHTGILSLLLHGQQHILTSTLQANHCVVLSKHSGLHLCLSGQAHQHASHD